MVCTVARYPSDRMAAFAFSSTTAAAATPDDARWRVRFAADLVTARRVTLDDGELWLHGDALRIVLLDARGHAVDARYLRPGEWIDIGDIVAFPCHFARVCDRAPAIGGNSGENAPPHGLLYGRAVHGSGRADRGAHRRTPHMTDGPGILGRGPVHHGADGRHIGESRSDRHESGGVRVSGGAVGIKRTAATPSSILDLDEGLAHFWSALRLVRSRVRPNFDWWEGKIHGDLHSFAQVVASRSPTNTPARAREKPPDRLLANPVARSKEKSPVRMRGDGFGAGRQGRGAGRFDRVRGRGFDSHVWKRKTEMGSSSTTNDKWEEAADNLQDTQEPVATGGQQAALPHRQEIQGGGSRSEKDHHTIDKNNPTAGNREYSSSGTVVPPSDACQICHLLGHFTVRCPQAFCERCKKRGHLSFVCNEFFPWDHTPVMCAFQTKGQGFFYIPDFSVDRQNRDNIFNIVVTITDGSALTKDIEHELSVYVGQGWRCSARFFAPQKFFMRMPNPREVERALFVEHIKLKKCGVSVKFSPWSEDIDSEGLLEIAWVKIGKIPSNKRCDKTIAYVGALVGITLEVDMSTINRPSSVRAKIGCRSIAQLPATAEGVLAGRFYRFTYEVEEVLGGKACRLLYDDNEGSPSTESDGDNSLLIETMQREIEEKMREGEVDSSRWIVPRNPDIMENAAQDIQIVEVTGEVDPGMKTSCSYVVQLPSPESIEEIILTPPLAPEAPLRFSKRNISGMQDKVEDRAKKMASKKNLEGNNAPTFKNSFDALSNDELISRANLIGVEIPNDDFAVVDIIRELECARKELNDKNTINNTDNEQDVLIVTNALGKETPVSLDWLDQEEHIYERISSAKPKKKKQSKSNVKIPRPVTRSQKRESTEEDLKCNPAPSPGRVTRTKFHKKRSK
ncbi:uncharacterized protein LOC119279489 [Triticum dicoccoides]|uniref:uncharacterized protein LOC119279489 n=1 Tax=Triticum dicoccoides TaxID=85692 RepID=UPI00188E5B3B|nr:uncharacterized protein LOC119279489 [Triticum dicoccoides]